MSALFGTDGIRGLPGTDPLTPGLVRRIGAVAARVFLDHHVQFSPRRNGGGPRILLGRDTRGSGPLLARWLTQAFARVGCVTVDVGILPTPAVAYLTPRCGALCGVVVSASHNPPEFNGIKFFTSQGAKAPVELELEIERRLASCPDPGQGPLRRWVVREPGLGERYLEYLRSTFPATRDLAGMRIVVDAANGSASRIAAPLLRRLGAEVFAIGDRPNGRNINAGCGALDTAAMRREVLRRRADCGVAFDGDADRAMLADERGRLLDGDDLMAMCARHLHRKGLLRGGKVVLTVMSNYGLIQYLGEQGIDSVQVPVGDRHVAEALEAGGYPLGGESSGHIIFSRFGPTGDGLLTCLQALAVAVESGQRMSRFRGLYRRYPQLLRSVPVARRVPLEGLSGLQRCLRESSRRLQGKGRVYVRYSGTEPVVRILVEGPRRALVQDISERLVTAFKKDVGG